MPMNCVLKMLNFVIYICHKNAKEGLPLWLNGKESTCQCRRHGPWSRKIPHAMEQTTEFMHHNY